MLAGKYWMLAEVKVVFCSILILKREFKGDFGGFFRIILVGFVFIVFSELPPFSGGKAEKTVSPDPREVSFFFSIAPQGKKLNKKKDTACGQVPGFKIIRN